MARSVYGLIPVTNDTGEVQDIKLEGAPLLQLKGRLLRDRAVRWDESAQSAAIGYFVQLPCRGSSPTDRG